MKTKKNKLLTQNKELSRKVKKLERDVKQLTKENLALFKQNAELMFNAGDETGRKSKKRKHSKITLLGEPFDLKTLE